MDVRTYCRRLPDKTANIYVGKSFWNIDGLRCTKVAYTLLAKQRVAKWGTL
jgi:hypothetical protein